jgi:hypothetical protein
VREIFRREMSLGLSPEETKPWSRNLGHADVLTTFTSYGQGPTQWQGEIIWQLRERRAASQAASPEVWERVLRRVRRE